MSLADLIRMALHNFAQRKLRTALNLTGIVTGCVVLLMTAAGSSGVKDAIHLLFDSAEMTRRIYIWPGGTVLEEPPDEALVVQGEMSDERRERIRAWLKSEWRRNRTDEQSDAPQVPRKIDQELLAELRDLPHVLEVTAESPVLHSVELNASDQPAIHAASGGMHFIDASLRKRMLAGEPLERDDEAGVLVSEITAYRFGFRSDADLQQLIGKTLTVEFLVSRARVASMYNLLISRWGKLSVDQLQGQAEFVQTLMQLLGDLDSTSLDDEQKEMLRQLVTQEQDATPIAEKDTTVIRQFVVRGVFHGDVNSVDPAQRLFRTWFHGNHNEIELLVHPRVSENMFLMRPDHGHAFYNATLLVDRTAHLGEVTDALKKRGMTAESAKWILENIDRQIDQSTWIFYTIAGVVLLTAGIGIFNTLVMSVLERTPEFGTMKSLGARNSDLTRLMLIEGILLGAIGAALAMLVSVVFAWCGRGILKMYVEAQTNTPLGDNLFQFQLLPALIATSAAVVICVIASILPAIRAARLDPIVAMRRV